MQSYHFINSQPNELNGVVQQVAATSNTTDTPPEDAMQIVNEPHQFYSRFIDSMEMYADLGTVARYFDVHHEWFRRCAHPMKAEAIGKNSYALIIGRYGSFGYEVEPKIGLDLLPQDNGIYRIETVPVPGYTPAGYDVDFRASMELVELTAEAAQSHSIPLGKVTSITQVQWQLDLTVLIYFPKFIQALPKHLIQSTGDRLLNQVVRQVSGRLTRKVLEDFHSTHNLPVPKRSSRWFFLKQEDADLLDAEGERDDPST